jgi:hypothetical protein
MATARTLRYRRFYWAMIGVFLITAIAARIRNSDSAFVTLSTSALLCRAADMRMSQAAETAILAKGEAAVPDLVAALTRQDSKLAEFYSKTFWSAPGWISKAMPKPIPASDLRHEAVNLLIRLGPEAKSAVPDLISQSRGANPQDLMSILRILAGIGPDARQAELRLKELIQMGDPATRLEAAGALSRIALNSPEAMSVLAAELNNPNIDMRMRAMEFHPRAGKGVDVLIPVMITLLNDGDARHADRVFDFISTTTSDEQMNLTPVLLKGLLHPAESIRQRATNALEALGMKL